jgi:hypothetical protein
MKAQKSLVFDSEAYYRIVRQLAETKVMGPNFER